MSDEDFSMSMRKFLKQVGVTSQRAIEDAMRDAGAERTAGRMYPVSVTLRIGELDLEHGVEGRIAGPKGDAR